MLPLFVLLVTAEHGFPRGTERRTTQKTPTHAFRHYRLSKSHMTMPASLPTASEVQAMVLFRNATL